MDGVEATITDGAIITIGENIAAIGGDYSGLFWQVTVTPISRPLVKSAEHFFWQRQLPKFFQRIVQQLCSNRARFFG